MVLGFDAQSNRREAEARINGAQERAAAELGLGDPPGLSFRVNRKEPSFNLAAMKADHAPPLTYIPSLRAPYGV